MTFSPQYREFMSDHGGGYFGFVLVLGVAPQSPWSVVDMNANARAARFLTLVDSGTGDLFGQSVDEEGRCASPIDIIDHEDRTIHRSALLDLYEMVVRLGLES